MARFGTFLPFKLAVSNGRFRRKLTFLIYSGI